MAEERGKGTKFHSGPSYFSLPPCVQCMAAVSPLKRTGVKWLHFEVLSAIQV